MNYTQLNKLLRHKKKKFKFLTKKGRLSLKGRVLRKRIERIDSEIKEIDRSIPYYTINLGGHYV